jgi:hypothetical protein
MRMIWKVTSKTILTYHYRIFCDFIHICSPLHQLCTEQHKKYWAHKTISNLLELLKHFQLKIKFENSVHIRQ